MTKHPMELGAEAFEAEAELPKNRKRRAELLAAAKHYREQAKLHPEIAHVEPETALEREGG